MHIWSGSTNCRDSKNGGMKLIPTEYDIHPSDFHTYGINSASMTFIPATVRCSYRGYEKHTEAACEDHTVLANRVIRSKVKQVVEGKSIYAFKKILYSARCMQCSIDASSELRPQKISYACKLRNFLL